MVEGNWHALQAGLSKDAFRSSHLSGDRSGMVSSSSTILLAAVKGATQWVFCAFTQYLSEFFLDIRNL